MGEQRERLSEDDLLFEQEEKDAQEAMSKADEIRLYEEQYGSGGNHHQRTLEAVMRGETEREAYLENLERGESSRPSQADLDKLELKVRVKAAQPAFDEPVPALDQALEAVRHREKLVHEQELSLEALSTRLKEKEAELNKAAAVALAEAEQALEDRRAADVLWIKASKMYKGSLVSQEKADRLLEEVSLSVERATAAHRRSRRNLLLCSIYLMVGAVLFAWSLWT